MTATTTDIAINATPDLSIIEGQVTTTSSQVAEHFGKRHADVIRAIKNLGASQGFTERNFALSDFTDSTGRKLPQYRITRDGFTLLAMGFTGKEAMQWKEAYLDAFNQMEAKLLEQSRPAIAYDRITPQQAQHLKELVQLVVESGKQNYGETWGRLQRKFQVNSYLQLLAAKFEEACTYLQGKLDGESIQSLITKHINPDLEAKPITDASRLSLAFNVASTLASTAQQAVFGAIVNGHDAEWMHKRYLFGVTYSNYNKLDQVWAQPIPTDAIIASLSEIAHRIQTGDTLATNAELATLAAACSHRLQQRITVRLN